VNSAGGCVSRGLGWAGSGWQYTVRPCLPPRLQLTQATLALLCLLNARSKMLEFDFKQLANARGSLWLHVPPPSVDPTLSRFFVSASLSGKFTPRAFVSSVMPAVTRDPLLRFLHWLGFGDVYAVVNVSHTCHTHGYLK
jgi:hypothetical protein